MIREIDNPTAEQVREDMLNRLRRSLADELHHVEQIIAVNVREMNRTKGPIAQASHKRRVDTHRRFRKNLERLKDALAQGAIGVTVSRSIAVHGEQARKEDAQ